MNITRTKNLFFAALLGILSLGFSSCSDSEDVVATGTLTVDPSYTTKGIETDVESAIIEVPVNCNGKWFAEVDNCNWLAVLDDGTPIHNGNGKIKLKFDENRTGADRKNSLYIVDFNDNLIEIPVRQNTLYRGEVPSNGADTWFNNNNVGSGADYTYLFAPDDRKGKDFDPLKVSKGNNLFNMAELELMNANGKYKGQLYNMSKIKISELNDKQLVNVISKDQHLDVSLEMSCSFGFIEFQGSGTYNSDLTDQSDHVNYVICRDAPVLNTNLGIANIATAVNEELKAFKSSEEVAVELENLYEKLDGLDVVKRKLSRQAAYNKSLNTRMPELSMLSVGFKPLYWELCYFNTVKDNLFPNDSVSQANKFSEILETIDSYYGPYFISGGQFGGSLNLFATVDKKNLDESTKFDASITANISSLFELSGKANFTSEGKQLYQKSDVKMKVFGGNAGETTAAVTEFLHGDMTNTALLADILKKWTTSFDVFEKDNDGVEVPTSAAPIVFYVSPIWTLFSDPALQKVVKDYFVAKYAKQGIETWNHIIESPTAEYKVEELLKKVSKDESSSSDKDKDKDKDKK